MTNGGQHPPVKKDSSGGKRNGQAAKDMKAKGTLSQPKK